MGNWGTSNQTETNKIYNSGAFSNSHRSNPLFTPQTMLDACTPIFFFDFQLCIGWRRGNGKNVSIRMHCIMSELRNDRKI